MQMMQMQGFMQMQQQVSQQATATAAQPPSQPSPSVPVPLSAAPLVVTSIVLINSSKDGNLVRADGQRVSVPIKVELNDAKEPTGVYSTVTSLRHKAASSFPDVGSDVSWKLYIGQMVRDQPYDISFVAGANDAESNSSWREIFSCKVIDGLKPVVFAQPCLVGHESRDVDRKRAASLSVATDKAETEAAVTVLSNARPEKRGKGPCGKSVRSGKEVAQLQIDARVARLQEQLKLAVVKSKTAVYSHPQTRKPIFILTDGKWVRPVFFPDTGKLISAGCLRFLFY